MFKPRFWTEQFYISPVENLYLNFVKDYSESPISIVKAGFDAFIPRDMIEFDPSLFDLAMSNYLNKDSKLSSTSVTSLSVNNHFAVDTYESHNFPTPIVKYETNKKESEQTVDLPIVKQKWNVIPLQFELSTQVPDYLKMKAFYPAPTYIRNVSLSQCIQNAYGMDNETFDRKSLILSIKCAISLIASIYFLYSFLKNIFVLAMVSFAGIEHINPYMIGIQAGYSFACLLYSTLLLLMYSHIRWQVKSDRFGSYYDRIISYKNKVKTFISGAC